MATRSPTRAHSHWGYNYASATVLPNTALSGVQSSTLEEGDTAFVPSEDTLYVCVNPTLNNAQWIAQALGNATRIIHTPGVTPTNATFVPGLAPEPTLFGTTIALHYKKDNDKVYGYSKIATSYVSDSSFHIHWTKNVDTSQAGATVRWVINYTVFSEGSQIFPGAPTGTLILDDTYDDSGTTTRVAYRTPNAAATGFVAGYYVSFEVGFDPANTTLSNRPAIISCDILSRQYINQAS